MTRTQIAIAKTLVSDLIKAYTDNRLRDFILETDFFLNPQTGMLTILMAIERFSDDPEEALILCKHLAAFGTAATSQRAYTEMKNRVRDIRQFVAKRDFDNAGQVLVRYRRYRVYVALVAKLFETFDESEIEMNSKLQEQIIKGRKTNGV